MRRSRVALYSLYAVVAIFAAIIGIALTMDFGRFKSNAEALVSELLDREFAIDGPLHLTLGRTVDLSAEGIRLASTGWSSDPQLARVRRIEASVNTWSLFSGPIMIESLAIDGVRINLEHDAEGQNNWTFFEHSEEQAEEETSNALGRFPVMLNNTSISDVILSYGNPDRSRPFRFAIAELTERIDDSDQLLIRLEGDLNETPLDLEAIVGSVEDLIELTEVEIELSGNLGEIRFEGNASLGDLLHPSRPTARLNLVGPNVEYLTDILRIDRITSGPLDLSLSISPNGERMQLNLSGHIGEFALLVNGQFADLQQLEDIELQVSASGPSANTVAEMLGRPNVPDDPFNIIGAFRRSGSEISLEEIRITIGETQFDISGQFYDFPDPNGANATVRINGSDFGRFNRLLGLPGRLSGPFRLDADLAPLEAGGAKVNLTAYAQNITISLDGDITDAPDLIGTDVRFELNGPNLAEILDAFGRDADELAQAPYHVSGRIERQPDHFVLHDVVATIGDELEYEFSADGTITDHPGLLGSRVRVAIRGKSLGVLTDAAGIDGFPNLPFDIEATVERVASGFVIDNGRLSLGSDSVTINGLVGEKPLSRDTDIQFEVTSPNLKATLAEFGIQFELLPAGDLRATGAIRSLGDSFFLQDFAVSFSGAEAQLSGRLGGLPTLEGTNLELTVSGDEFSRLLPPSDAFRKLDKPFTLATNIRVIDGTLELSSVVFQIDQTRLAADLAFALNPVLDRGKFSLEATSPDLFVLSPQFAEMAATGEAPFELRASGDWTDNLWNVNEFDMKLAEGTLRVSGTVDGPPNFDETDLSFDWSISSLSNFSFLAGRELPDEPAHFRFHLAGTREVLSVSDFDGVFGDSDISGEFSMRGGDIPTIEIDFTSNRLNLTAYLPPESEALAEQPSESVPEDGRLIPDIPIRVDILEKFLATVNIHIDEMNLRERTLRDITLIGSVVDGTLTVNEFDLKSADGGELSGQMILRPADNGVEFGMRLLGSNITIGLPAYTAEELDALPTYELNLAFITAGDTVREMAGNMNGYLRLVGSEGRIRFGTMRMFTQDFLSELLSALNPFSASDPYSNLKCTAVLAAVEDGQVVGAPVLVLQSDKLNIFVNATVDLKTERLSAEFNTVPQQGLGISLSNLINPYVRVSGTLANPALGFNPESALIEGGLAVATGGLSILALSFKDRFLSTKDPCGKAISDADESFRALEQRYGGSGITAQE